MQIFSCRIKIKKKWDVCIMVGRTSLASYLSFFEGSDARHRGIMDSQERQ